ncbi:MAG: sigma-70 family RNA polymerase sigma factor [Brumimicrobium sp.]
MIKGKRKYQKLSDNELAQLFKEKPSNEVIGEVYLRFGHLMMGTCLKYLKNKQEAEDSVMEIFESLPEKLKNHSVSHFKSWIYMVTKNNCLMKLRKKNIPTSEINDRINISSEDFLNEKVTQENQIKVLEIAIDSLKEEQKEAVKLFYFERKSYQEVSELMQLPIKKVKSAIQNGKRNLKLKLENNDHFKSA